MGLDMYFTRRTFVYSHQREMLSINLPGIEAKKVCEIREGIAYWRKANAIHAWFVKNVQEGKDDCEEYYVDNDKIQELVDTCKKVLADNSLAESLLPSQSGFFFGQTAYNEYYFDDLRATVKMLTPYIDNKRDNFYYRASW